MSSGVIEQIKQKAFTIHVNNLSREGRLLIRSKRFLLEEHVLALLDGKHIVDEPKGDLVERLASLEHEQWSHWINYQESVNNLTALDKWIRQSQTPYNKLTEKEKESDREWARKVLVNIQATHLCIPKKKLQKAMDALFISWNTKKLEVCDSETKESWVVKTLDPDSFQAFYDALDNLLVVLKVKSEEGADAK